jgi:TPR repeat protein
MYNMAIFHHNGNGGVPANPARALELFRAAADHAAEPFPMAQNYLGKIARELFHCLSDCLVL